MPKGFAFDGKNKSQVMMGKPSNESRTLFWEYGRNTEAFKFPKGRDRSPNLAIREGKWKLVINDDGTEAELYNLESDSKETTNLIQEEPKVANKLKNKLLDWRKSMPELKSK